MSPHVDLAALAGGGYVSASYGSVGAALDRVGDVARARNILSACRPRRGCDLRALRVRRADDPPSRSVGLRRIWLTTIRDGGRREG